MINNPFQISKIAPDLSNGTNVSVGFVCPKNGYLLCVCSNGLNINSKVDVNSKPVAGSPAVSGSQGNVNKISTMVMVSKGSTVTAINNSTVTFFKCKGDA